MSTQESKLIVIAGANQGIELPLEAGPCLLGRDLDCDLVLVDNYASRQHCWVEPRGTSWWLRDLGSRNGTVVNQELVQNERELHDGDLIVIGTTHIRFSDPEETRIYSAHAVKLPRLLLDVGGRTVRVEGKAVEPPLSLKQWQLISLLCERRGEVVTKDEIANGVWPEAEGNIFDHQIDKLVSRLRARLGPLGDDLIETVYGTGYRLVSD